MSYGGKEAVTYPPNDGLVAEDELKDTNPLFRWINKAIETRGVERVPEDERDGTHAIGLLLFWWSVNMVVTTLPLGMLAQAFYSLDFSSTVMCIIVFSGLGSATVGFIATLGPQTGMRTMVITRYSMGFVGGSIFSLLNILTQHGFSVVALILGGNVLTGVSNGKLPLEASVVIVGVMSVVLCFFGYSTMHYWERYAWIIMFIFYWGGGGKFILVMFAFSIISNCIPNTYSAALSIQALAPVFQEVPRAVWTIVVFLIYTVASIAGRDHFSAILSNFLAILGYWIAFFVVVVAEEHFIFREFIIPGGYDLTAYHDIKRWPVGAAGIYSCCAAAGVAIVSMAQTWYIGPLAKTFGEYGGDLGFEMSFITAGVLYPPLRYIEYRFTRR